MPNATLELPSTPGGLAFLPKGLRLAIAHYNGVTLWFPNAQTEPERLAWKGSHLGVTVSPDGRFVVTTMQEPMLHGWRLADAKDMRMSGYSARVRSLAWTPGGKWLATSGSNQLVLWPFQAKDGPMGKQPRIVAPTEVQIEAVACHPKQDVVAVGCMDGLVLIVDASRTAPKSWPAGRRRVRQRAGLERLRPHAGIRHRRRRRRRDRARVRLSGAKAAGQFFGAALGAFLVRSSAGAAGVGSSALSGRRFQIWLRPSSAKPRKPRTSSCLPSGLSRISARYTWPSRGSMIVPFS